MKTKKKQKMTPMSSAKPALLRDTELDAPSAVRLLIALNAHVALGERIGQGPIIYGAAAASYGAGDDEIAVPILESTDPTDALDMQTFCDLVPTLPGFRLVKNADRTRDHVIHALIVRGGDAAAETAADTLMCAATERAKSGGHKSLAYEKVVELVDMIAQRGFIEANKLTISPGIVVIYTAL